MAERIFFISPLPESEEEKKAYYDKYGTATPTSYNEQPAHPQGQPKEDINTENRVIIIYEAPKTQVATQQDQTLDIIPTIPTPEEILTTNPHPQPAEYTARTRTEDLLTMLYGNEPRKTSEDLLTMLYGNEPRKTSEDLLTMLYGNEPRKTSEDLLTMLYGTQEPYSQTLENIYGEQSPTETNQLASIRSELRGMTTTPEAPEPQAGELAQAA